MGCGIICLHWGSRLWVAKVFKDFAHGYDCFCIDEEGAKFGLHCGGHYSSDYLQYVEDGVIVAGDVFIASHKRVASGATVCLRF